MPRGIGKTRPRCWATTTATCGVVQALIVVILERGGSVHESIRHLETIIVTCATFTLAKSGANFTASPGAAAHTRVLHGGGGVRRRRARHRCWYIRWRGRVSDVPASGPGGGGCAPVEVRVGSGEVRRRRRVIIVVSMLFVQYGARERERERKGERERGIEHNDAIYALLWRILVT